jgi:protoporphyrinogen oxidase
VGLYLRLTNNWKNLEKYTVDEWLRKWAGKKAYELMWQPLVIGKFGERYYRQVNMAWMWARLKSRTTRLGTFEGGFQNFANLFADRLRQMGVEIRLQTPITRIWRDEASGQVNLESGQVQQFDQVLVTLSPEAAARMVPSLPEEYLHGLRSLQSMGAVVLTLALKHQLSEQGYYWYNLPKSAGYPFLALVEHTNFVPADKFGGDHIVYVGDYLEPEHEFFKLSQEQLLERFLPALKKFNPKFEPDWVRKAWLFRTAYAQPVPLVNHSKNIPAIQTPLKGIFFASMSQVYPWDRGTNFAVEIGRKAARLMMESGSK